MYRDSFSVRFARTEKDMMAQINERDGDFVYSRRIESRGCWLKLAALDISSFVNVTVTAKSCQVTSASGLSQVVDVRTWASSAGSSLA